MCDRIKKLSVGGLEKANDSPKTTLLSNARHGNPKTRICGQTSESSNLWAETRQRARGGLGLGEAKSPVGTILVGGKGYGRGFRIFAYYEGGVQRFRESAFRG